MGKDKGYTVGALAAQPIDDRDEAVLGRVRDVFAAADPVPDGLVERLQFAITLDALHAELAELQRMDGLVGARGGATSDVQTVTFSSQNMTIMITATPVGPDRVRIDGWVADGADLMIELRTASGQLSGVADVDGRFVFDDVERGMAQFVVRRPEGSTLPPVVTPSVEI